MKYIILNLDGREEAILFPRLLRHSQMVPSFLRDRIVSAGHFHLAREGDDLNVQTYGDSSSLGTDPRPIDGQIILQRLLEIEN